MKKIEFDKERLESVKPRGLSDLQEEYQQERLRQGELHPSDPHHWDGFIIDKAGTVSIWWGGYEYRFELTRIPDPLALLEWTAHLTGKGWTGMTLLRVSHFIEAVCVAKGWNLWRDV